MLPKGSPYSALCDPSSLIQAATADCDRRQRSLFFNTMPEFWLNMQQAVDIYEALEEHRGEYKKIKSLVVGQHV